ncbi:MAG: hypothetical protein ABUL44_03330 [Flavobacterium sp.]
MTLMKMMLVILTFASVTAFAQTASIAKPENKKSMETKEMKMYVIEREIPGAGKFSIAELKTISQT